MRAISLILIGSAIASCTTAPPPPARSAEARAELQTLLAGKVAGQPMACLPHYRADNMIVIDDNTIAFRDGKTVYRNDLRSGCARLGNTFYTLVTRRVGGSGLCSGDLAEVVDFSSGTTVGTCVLGDFVPYRQS